MSIFNNFFVPLFFYLTTANLPYAPAFSPLWSQTDILKMYVPAATSLPLRFFRFHFMKFLPVLKFPDSCIINSPEMVYILTAACALRVSVKIKFEYKTPGLGKFPSILKTNAGGVGVKVGDIVAVGVMVGVSVTVKVGLTVNVIVGVKLGSATIVLFEWPCLAVPDCESIKEAYAVLVSESPCEAALTLTQRMLMP